MRVRPMCRDRPRTLPMVPASHCSTIENIGSLRWWPLVCGWRCSRQHLQAERIKIQGTRTAVVRRYGSGRTQVAVCVAIAAVQVNGDFGSGSRPPNQRAIVSSAVDLRGGDTDRVRRWHDVHGCIGREVALPCVDFGLPVASSGLTSDRLQEVLIPDSWSVIGPLALQGRRRQAEMDRTRKGTPRRDPVRVRVERADPIGPAGITKESRARLDNWRNEANAVGDSVVGA